MSVDDLIKKANEYYTVALKLLDSRDIYDAAEKAWCCVETLRKALLVALGVPYDKAKSVSYGVPLFNKIMKALGLKELLKDYEWFHYKLHAMGFYENITPLEDIVEIVRNNVPQWMNEILKIIDKVKGLDFSSVLHEYEKMHKLKREILMKNIELVRISEKVSAMLDKLLAPVRTKL